MSNQVPSKWVVICCPVAGKKQAKPTVDNILVPKMKELGLEVEVRETESAGHATTLAKEFGSADVGLIAVGGDGTIHEVMDGLIESGKLADVRLGLLSQGTMNFYAHSGGLPDAARLPDVLKAGTYRSASLMKIASNDADGKAVVDTMCFEALYFGVGYKPAKGAQVWRNSWVGPMFGIMKELVMANLRPANTAIPGTLTLTVKKTGEELVLKDTFFWIVACLRNPYNGCLGDDMWVSVLTLKDFPGFGRMMEFFTPPMECQSCMTACFTAHYKVTKFQWARDEGNIGVCLDGDPTDAGPSITGELCPNAWNVVGDEAYLSKMPDDIIKVGKMTPAAQTWLDANPVPEGVTMPAPGTKPVKK